MNLYELKKLLTGKIEYAAYMQEIEKITAGSDRATIHYKNGDKFVFTYHIEQARQKNDDLEAV